jgi:hypothetical protein
MLQRIQSVYLLLGFLVLLASLLSANAVFTIGDSTINFSAFGLLSEQNTQVSIRFPFLLMLVSLGIPMLGFLACIFLFQNRKFQMKMVRLCSLLVLVHVAAEAFLYKHAIETLEGLFPGKAITTQWGIGSMLPLVCIALSMLAVSRIKHDEELVRSADRIR